MDWSLALDNLLSAPILFFIMGVLAGLVKADLSIPEAVTKLLSLYLMWAIGLKGGIKISQAEFTGETIASLGAAFVLACVVPVYVYALLRKPLGAQNAAALCAVYGSVSAVTFLTATAFLERRGIEFGGHMVAALALMESPAILIAVLFARRAAGASESGEMPSLAESLREAALNGPLVLLTGSMAIGAITGSQGHEALKPLYVDLFPGVLTFFLLELGLVAARRARVLRVIDKQLLLFGITGPLINAALGTALAWIIGLSPGNAFLLIVLAASASYIAAPAAVRHAIPRASPGLYLPLALAITFPFNITIGLPLYWAVVNWLW
jgi:hypothetical protein